MFADFFHNKKVFSNNYIVDKKRHKRAKHKNQIITLDSAHIYTQSPAGKTRKGAFPVPKNLLTRKIARKVSSLMCWVGAESTN